MAGKRKETTVGTILDGRYRLDEIIGHGTMGTVYKATQLNVNRSVAVKVLNTSVQHHPKLQQRFETEARAVGRLSHPNVLTLFDFAYSMERDVLYMATEFIEGETLGSLIARGISPELALTVAFQVANALAHAHEEGVAHRDLKPGNVMLAKERRGERVKVLDFGLARMRDDVSERATTAGEVQGAPGYISPEQCVGDIETGPPTDIYALGVIMYEMFEGRLPFDYTSPTELMNAHISEPPPAVSNEAIAQDVRDLVHQMLSKSPEQRPNADRIMDVLSNHVSADAAMETLLRRNPRPAAPAIKAPQLPPSDLSLERRKRDNRDWLLASLLALVAALAALLLFK